MLWLVLLVWCVAAVCYLGRAWGGQIVAFIAVIPSFGRLPAHVSMRRREHRVVVLPDYQGVGFGSRLSDAIGHYYSNLKHGAQYVLCLIVFYCSIVCLTEYACRYHSKTTHPRFGLYRDTSPLWETKQWSGKLSRRDSLGKDFYSSIQRLMKRRGSKSRGRGRGRGRGAGRGGAGRKRSSEDEDEEEEEEEEEEEGDSPKAKRSKALPPAAGASLLLEHGADGIAADSHITAQLPDPYDLGGEFVKSYAHFYQSPETNTLV
jgi:GNAT superfamily N-acetyltransferase